MRINQDFYARKAKELGYPARSVFKFKEIDDRYKIIKKKDSVLDLGCAPGSWLLYLSEKAKKVTGVDIQDINIELKDNISFIKKNIEEFDIGEKFNVIVSDLAPSTSGIKAVDAHKSLMFCEKAFELAQKLLVPHGNFVCKIFAGEGVDEFIKELKKKFKLVKCLTPKAVRKESKEFYIIAKDYK